MFEIITIKICTIVSGTAAKNDDYYTFARTPHRFLVKSYGILSRQFHGNPEKLHKRTNQLKMQEKRDTTEIK